MQSAAYGLNLKPACYLHTLWGAQPQPHPLTPTVTHMFRQLTYVIIAQTRKFSPAAQRQSSSNCSQMYAMFFSIFLAVLTLRSAATLPHSDALLPPNGRSFSKYLCCRLVGQHRILATVATAPCLCHSPSCLCFCLCLCQCYLCPCHCPWHWHCHCCCLFCSSLTFDVTVSPA